MTFEETLNYIYSRKKFAESSSLERISAVLSLFENVQTKLRFVHVLGTNGKGSVSAMISSVLFAEGYKVGLFTSPFVVDFCERIQINGEYISRADFCRYAETVKTTCEPLPEKLKPTFFEFILAVALLYFHENGCDIVVLEAGIGGRDDSTNIIPPPEVTVFTSISLDHTEVLGDTVKKIAKSKAGALKSGSIAVSFPNETAGLDFIAQSEDACCVLRQAARETNCTLLFPNMRSVKLVSESVFETRFYFEGLLFSTRLIGEHQIANAACALTALNALRSRGFKIGNDALLRGIENAFLPARAEVISKAPLTILDGGHNEGAVRTLEKLILRYMKGKKITLLAAFMKDKDYKTALSLLAPHCENIVFTLAESGRGEEPDVLKAHAKKYCANVFSERDPETALKAAKQLTPNDEALIIAGSFYLASKLTAAKNKGLTQPRGKGNEL